MAPVPLIPEDQMSAAHEHHGHAAPQYDSIGAEYDKVKQTLFARYPERFTFLRALATLSV